MINSPQLHTALTIVLTVCLILRTEICECKFSHFHLKRSNHKRHSYECQSVKCVYGFSASLCKVLTNKTELGQTQVSGGPKIPERNQK